jgi:ligand-binding sensor domain-containing protein
MKTLWALVIILLPALIFGVRLDDLRERQLTQEELHSLVKTSIITSRVEEFGRLTGNYSGNIRGLDLARAYYEVGMEFYEEGLRNLAFTAFRNGFVVFDDSRFKARCAYMMARTFFERGQKESALYYINRAMERGGDDKEFVDTLFRLRRRIRWDYIGRYEGLPDESISAIEFDGDDVWIGMWTGGVARFTRSSKKLAVFRQRTSGLISDHVRDIAVDSRYVWVGTYDGLCRYDKRTGDWSVIRSGMGHTSVKRVEFIGGRLYVATLGRGLFYVDQNSLRWVNVLSDARNVTDIIEADGRIFVATLDKGVYVSDGSGFKNIISSGAAKAISFMDGHLWVATFGNGIILIDTKTMQMVNQLRKQSGGLSSDYIEALYSVKGKMIIGLLEGGVNIYDTKTGKFNRIGLVEGIPSPDVVRIAIEKEWIWFGTIDGGIGILFTENFEDI